MSPESPVQVVPRLSAQLAGWSPMQEPGRGAAEVAALRPLLESDSVRDAIFQESLGASSDPYARLLAVSVLPALNSAITNEWEPRQPDALLQVGCLNLH